MRKSVFLRVLLLLALFSATWVCSGAIPVALDEIETLVSENKLTEAKGRIENLNKGNLDNEGKSFLRYQEARISYRKKDYSAAITILDDILAKYSGTPKHASSKYLKGYSCFYIEDYETSKECFGTFFKDHPEHPCAADACIRFANLSFLDEDKTIKEKKEIFQQVIDLYPNSSVVFDAKKSLAALSWAESEQEKTLEKKHQVEQMYKALEKEAQTDKDKGFAALHIAALNLEMERVLKDQDGDYPINYNLVIELCNKTLDVAPASEKETRATAELIKSESIYYSQTPKNAIKAFQDLLKKYGKEEKCRTQAAFAQYMLGMVYMKTKDFEKAQESFNKVLSQYEDAPNFKGNNVQATSLLWLAQMMFEQDRFEESLSYISQIKEQYSESKEAKMADNLSSLVESASKGVSK